MWQRFQALPAYPGGKRRLAPRILKDLPGPNDTPTFVDCFGGGLSGALFAKARGYRVLCNDIALRSYIAGKALIENDRVTLSKEDITQLFVENEHNSHFVERNFAPDVVTTKHAKFLDTALSNARTATGAKKWLLLLLLVKYILRMRPMGNFGAKRIVHEAEAGQWEHMNQHFVKDILNRGIACHPKTVAETLRQHINRGVFGNGQENQVHQMDVFEFLRTIETSCCLFMDPPYAGTSAYETSLKVLDSILEGIRVEPTPSYFSKTPAIEALERLFEASRHFPVWAISYGNAELDLEDIVTLVGKFKRDVRSNEYRMTHMSGLASKEHKERNREFIIVAKGDR